MRLLAVAKAQQALESPPNELQTNSVYPLQSLEENLIEAKFKFQERLRLRSPSLLRSYVRNSAMERFGFLKKVAAKYVC